MRTMLDCSQEPALILDRGHVLFEVPWDRADRFQELLRRQGIASILHLDARAREARLEPHSKLDADQILEILRGR